MPIEYKSTATFLNFLMMKNQLVCSHNQSDHWRYLLSSLLSQERIVYILKVFVFSCLTELKKIYSTNFFLLLSLSCFPHWIYSAPLHFLSFTSRFKGARKKRIFVSSVGIKWKVFIFHFTFLPLASWLMMKHNDNFKMRWKLMMRKLFIVEKHQAQSISRKEFKAYPRKSWSRTFFNCCLSRFLTLLSSFFLIYKDGKIVYLNILFESNFLFLIPIPLICTH